MPVRFNVCPKDRVDFGLILLFFVLEPIQYVMIKSKRYDFRYRYSSSLVRIRFGFRADDEASAHRQFLIRSRTIPHGDPSSGF